MGYLNVRTGAAFSNLPGKLLQYESDHIIMIDDLMIEPARRLLTKGYSIAGGYTASLYPEIYPNVFSSAKEMEAFAFGGKNRMSKNCIRPCSIYPSDEGYCLYAEYQFNRICLILNGLYELNAYLKATSFYTGEMGSMTYLVGEFDGSINWAARLESIICLVQELLQVVDHLPHAKDVCTDDC